MEWEIPAWMMNNPAHADDRFMLMQGFPTVMQLRNGIMRENIRFSFWLAANSGEFAHNQYWDGDTYVDENDQGERWAVCFRDEGAVAVFYSSESSRNPYPEGQPPYDQDQYFASMPAELAVAKEHALGWMLDLDFVVGGANAVITAAMWATGDRFTASEPWQHIFWHGLLWVCCRQVLPDELTITPPLEDDDLDERQFAAFRSIYQRKLTMRAVPMPLEPWEREVFLTTGSAAEPDDEGVAAARKLLLAEGILL